MGNTTAPTPSPKPLPSKEEREKFAAEAEAARALARFNLANAAKAEAESEVYAIARDRAIEEREYEKALDEFQHIYNFEGPIDGKSVGECMRRLSQWSRMYPEGEFTIVFFSPGGSVIAGMALWDFLKELQRKGHKLTTVARGYAASMAGILLQAGDVRMMGPESYMLVHEVAAQAIGKIGEMEDEMKFLRLIQSRIIDIFADRSKLSKREFEKRWKRSDWWLDSKEALEVGFIDKIG